VIVIIDHLIYETITWRLGIPDDDQLRISPIAK
jgi:hypothetical protein